MTGPATHLAMQILRPTSDFKGTNVVIKALSTWLETRLVTSSVATTVNNHPAPIQVTRTDGYLRSVQSNVTGVNAVVSTSLIPGQITTGFIMTVTPRFLDHDRLMLTYNIDLSRLLPFTTASIGSGDTTASIQIPNFERRAFMQAVAVKAGDTLVLSGFEQADDQADLEAPLHPENSLFGSRQMARKRSRLVILLTPVIVGNGTV
jgi:type IVB pilus formation R64 PilN family outer membrane protein